MTSFDHEELRSQIGAYALGALTAAEQAAVRAHLAVCPECAAEARAMQSTTDSLAWSVSPVDPPPAVRQRVLASVGAAAPATMAPAVSRSKAPVSRPLAPWLAAAAALVAAVGLGAYASQLRGRVQSLEVQLADAILQVQNSQRQVTQARLVATSAQQQLSVLAAPDVLQVALKGLKPAPQATARGLWSRSRGLLLTASNLPPLPPGRTYQLWMLNGNNNPPTSDFWIFKPDGSGDAMTMFTTAATLAAPAGMAISLEPDGGSRTPTEVYVAGLVTSGT